MTKVVSLNAKTRGSRRSAAEWRELIASFRRSGETRKEFCARRGLALSTFAWWQSRLRSQPAAVVPELPVFLELLPEVATTATAKGIATLDLELELGDGLVIRLRRTPC